MRSMLLAIVIGLLVALQVTAEPPASEAPAATVNGQPITLADLDAAIDATLRTGTPLTAGQRKHLRATLLEELIDDSLVKQFLVKHGPKVDPAELDAQLNALKAQLTKANRTLADYLKQTRQTESQLRATWTAQLQLDAYVKQQVTDEQLKAYHAANRDHFDRVEVRVSHILVRIGKSALAADRALAKEKLRAVRAEIAAGKIDFATAAKRFSHCPSGKTGGDLGFVVRRGLPEDEPLAQAAFAMKVGDLSDVVETDYGFHILTVTDRKPGTPSEMQKCRAAVLEAYTDDYRIELVKKLRKEAQIKVTLP
jgi:peptidyl-prolyl cis-trans isomerase C